MGIVDLFFYIFSGIAIFSSLMVVTLRNPVHAILFLVLAFLNSACLFLLVGAEFLAMILIVVYIGAVAVLFLFIVMMLDIDVTRVREGLLSYTPTGVVVMIFVLTNLWLAYYAWEISPHASDLAQVPLREGVSNIQAFGEVLYTRYMYHFQLAGLILLVAMVGSILLALHHRSGVRRQDVAKQVARRPEDSIEIRKVNSGQGI